MVTEDMVDQCVSTYYSTLAGVSFRIQGELDSERVNYLRNLYSEDFRPTINLYTPIVGGTTLQNRAFRSAESQGAYQFAIGRVAFLESAGDVVIAVKATQQAPGLPATEFVEVFVATVRGDKLLIKQQSYSERKFVAPNRTG